MKRKKNLLIVMAAVIPIFFSACSKKPLELPESITELYKLNTEVEEARNYLKYRKIEIPVRIRELVVSCRLIYDRSQVIIQLVDDSIKNGFYEEIGLYDFNKKEYKTLFFSKGAESFNLRACNEKYLVFEASKDDFDTSALFGYSFETGEIFDIYSYSVNPNTNRAVYLNPDSVLLAGNALWFDDYCLSKDEKLFIYLYTYDMDTRTLERKERDARNPLLHKGKVHYLVKNERD